MMERLCGTPREIFNSVNDSSDPPPATNQDFLAFDDGSATPRYLRLTVNALAQDSTLHSKSSLPLGVVLTPFADPEPGENMVPEVDLTTEGGGGPLRCSRCRAYANPGFRFVESGLKFYCNLCGHVNETPSEHMCDLNPNNGLRLDIDHRHEFRYGSVEYVQTSTYLRPLHRPFSDRVSLKLISPALTQSYSLFGGLALRFPRLVRLASSTPPLLFCTALCCSRWTRLFLPPRWR